MLAGLGVVEQRYRAVVEVLEGASVTEVARRNGVVRQTVHKWLRRYAAGGIGALADVSSRPGSCPHQTPPETEVRVLALRREHPGWGPARIVFELGRAGVTPVPGRSSVYRALVRHGVIEPRVRRRRRQGYRRWERSRAMELWQMDVMGGVRLADGTGLSVVTGIDDHSRFVVCARLVARATARPVCQALLGALAGHGVPEQILTDNGKVFTARFGPGPGPVLFDRICAENGIRHLLTAPYSPTTTGKAERLHKTMRKEFFRAHDRQFPAIEAAQAALDAWVEQYNTVRPHQGAGMRPPAERFALAGPAVVAASDGGDPVRLPRQAGQRPPGVTRWVNQQGTISLAGFTYRAGPVFAGELVEVVCTRGLVEILHRGVLVATHVQRTRPARPAGIPRVQAARRPRAATTGPTVTRIADGAGAVSFAGTMYHAGRAWARHRTEVSIVAGSVQLACDGKVIRVHPARHDRAREHGAFANPGGRPRKAIS
jgi:transposase InsO family protein